MTEGEYVLATNLVKTEKAEELLRAVLIVDDDETEAKIKGMILVLRNLNDRFFQEIERVVTTE